MSTRAKAYLTILVILAGSVGLVVWMRRAALHATSERAKVVGEGEKPSGTSHIPRPAKHGPYPKVVVDNPVYNFGIMEFGQAGSHSFVVRNEGEAPLELYANPAETTCQCTLGKVGKPVLQPGESTEIEVKWHIKIEGPLFSHSALVRTNDPKKTQFRLRIVGWIGQVLGLMPVDAWDFGRIGETGEHHCSGIIYSDVLDHFNILKAECPSPLVSARWEPMTPDELWTALGRNRPLFADGPEAEDKEAAEKKEATDKPKAEGQENEEEEEEELPPEDEDEEFDPMEYVQVPKPKCGYRVYVTLKEGVPIGRFRETLTLVTDARDGLKREVLLQGYRPGPMQIIAMNGVLWWPEETLLQLGRFSASEGKVAKFSLFMEQVEGGVQVEVADVSPPALKLTLKPDPTFHSKKRVRFLGELRVEPGKTLALTSQSPGKIILKTNHPRAKQILIHVQGVSY